MVCIVQVDVLGRVDLHKHKLHSTEASEKVTPRTHDKHEQEHEKH
jgi:hypothetical protein